MAAILDSSRPLADGLAARRTRAHWPRELPQRTAAAYRSSRITRASPPIFTIPKPGRLSWMTATFWSALTAFTPWYGACFIPMKGRRISPSSFCGAPPSTPSLFLTAIRWSLPGHYNQRIVVYPIGSGTKRGRLLTNWICQMTVSDSAPPREDWNRHVSEERILAAFDAWRFPWLDVPALIRRTPEIYEFPLVDRHPVGAWTFGRVTLIGDAAHPMQPIGSQAGPQAIIDARALTAALLGKSNSTEPVKRYDAERRPVMNDVVLRNRDFGPEAALQLVEERAPLGFERIEDVVSRGEDENHRQLVLVGGRSRRRNRK